MGQLYSEKRGPSVIYGLIGGRWHGEAAGRLTRSTASFGIGFGENIWLLLGGPELETGTKKRDAGCPWSNSAYWLAAAELLGRGCIIAAMSCLFCPLVVSLHHPLACEWLTNSRKARGPGLHLPEIIQLSP